MKSRKMHKENLLKKEIIIKKNQELKNKMKNIKDKTKISKKKLIQLEKNSKENINKLQNRSFEIINNKGEEKKNHTGLMEHNKEIKYKLQDLKGEGREKINE